MNKHFKTWRIFTKQYYYILYMVYYQHLIISYSKTNFPFLSVGAPQNTNNYRFHNKEGVKMLPLSLSPLKIMTKIVF